LANPYSIADADIDRAAKAVDAADLKARLESRIHDKERAIISRAIGEYRGNTLTGDNARAYFAAIAEIRGLLIDLDRDVRQGQEARHRLMSPSPDGTATRSR
jgi:hypothetical protein